MTDTSGSPWSRPSPPQDDRGVLQVFDEARVSPAKAIELEPEMNLLAAAVSLPCGGNPQYWTLYEKIGTLHLRRAGTPDK